MKKQKVELSLKPFLYKILLWLPITFTVWYFSGPAIIAIAALLADTVLPLLIGHGVESVAQQGLLLEVVTPFEKESAGQFGEIIFSINAMKYGYGVALLLTLILATPDRLGRKALKFILGFLILLITQLWGVGFNIMKVLVFSLGPDVAEKMLTTPAIREIVVLGYQFGFLILPSVTPVVIWIMFYQEFVKTLAVKE